MKTFRGRAESPTGDATAMDRRHAPINARAVVASCCFLLVCATGVTTLRAQTVRGAVTAAGTREPVAGAVVSAMSQSGEVLHRTITNRLGRYALPVSPSASVLRVLRIGFTPRTVSLPTRDSVLVVDVELTPLRTLLAAVEVHANSRCAARKDRATALALLEQVRSGLLATIVAQEASPARLKILRFQRYMVGRSSRISSQDVYADSVAPQARAFQAVRTARDFVRDGFTRDSAGTMIFLAPDAEVMLDDSFRAGYCFRIISSDRDHTNQVGLAFSAADHRRGIVDIDGAVWVDTTRWALKSIDYRYLGLDPTQQAFRPGGHVEFREMPNGAVLIDRWWLRLVAVRLDTTSFTPVGANERLTYEVHETGGELARAQWSDGTQWPASLGALSITARTRDSLPATGARLQLEYTNYEGVVDADGHLKFVDVLPGPYKLFVIDSILTKIDVKLDPQMAFEAFRDSTHVVRVIVPTAMDYARGLCPAEPNTPIRRVDWERGSTSFLPRPPEQSVAFFVYVTTPDGKPVPNIRITEAITSSTRVPRWNPQAFGGRADKGGRYFSCWNFLVDEVVQVWVKPDGQEAQLTLVPLKHRVNAIRIVVQPKS